MWHSDIGVGVAERRRRVTYSGPLAEMLKKYTREFLLSSSQHGLKYIALPGQALLERSAWTAVIILCFLTSVYFIFISLEENYERPTITAVQSIRYPLHKFLFPAITICSLNKVHKSQARRIISGMKLPSYTNVTEVLEDFKVLTQLIEAEEFYENPKLIRLQTILDENNISINELMVKVVPQCDRMLKKCKWKGKQPKKCMDYFRVTRTEEGFCCSFNYQVDDELSSTNAEDYKYYADKESQNAKRSSTCHTSLGLTLLIDNEINEYHSTLMSSYGVKVIFHNPYDYPDISAMSTIVPPGELLYYSVSPTIFETSVNVRTIPIERRLCRFVEEIHRVKNNLYSSVNCLNNCRRKLTIQLCGCAPFYYINLGNSKICKLTDVPCLARHQKAINTLLLNFDEDYSKYPCDCVPLCEKTVYTIRQSISRMNKESAISRRGFLPDDPCDAKRMRNFNLSGIKDTDTAVRIYYGDTVGTRYQMRKFHGYLDMLASLGGLLSFFLGISVASLIETAYFFSIRIIFSKPTRGTADSVVQTTAVTARSFLNNTRY